MTNGAYAVIGFDGESEGRVTSGHTRAEAVRALFYYLPEWETLTLVHPNGEREVFEHNPDVVCGCNDAHCQV